MAALGTVGVFTRQGDRGAATVTPASPTGVTGGAPHGSTGRTTGDSGITRAGALYVGQAVQTAAAR